MVKNLPAKVGDSKDPGSIRRLGRSPEGRNGNPSQYSSQENLMDRGDCQGTVHGVTRSQTQLSKHTQVGKHSQVHKHMYSACEVASVMSDFLYAWETIWLFLKA